MKTSIGLIVLAASALVATAAPAINFLGQPYQLASYNQKHNPMWEFAAPSEKIDNWTTLLTVIDRPDAKSRADLDRLSQGILDTYKSRGGRVLMAKTMVDPSTGAPFNYMIVAFEEPQKKRFELNFVKAALGSKNAFMMVYGVRVSDPKDYTSKAKAFLSQNSEKIGKALESTAAPATATLPRREF